jgi:hypothetical protein
MVFILNPSVTVSSPAVFSEELDEIDDLTSPRRSIDIRKSGFYLAINQYRRCEDRIQEKPLVRD